MAGVAGLWMLADATGVARAGSACHGVEAWGSSLGGSPTVVRGWLWSAVHLQVSIGATGDDGHLALLTQVSPLFVQMTN